MEIGPALLLAVRLELAGGVETTGLSFTHFGLFLSEAVEKNVSLCSGVVDIMVTEQFGGGSLDRWTEQGDCSRDDWKSGIFVRAAEMVDLRVDDFSVESFTATRQHEENSRCFLCDEDHREDAQGVEYVPTENGCCRKGEGRGVSKSRRFRMTLERRRTRLVWDSASPDFVRMP